MSTPPTVAFRMLNDGEIVRASDRSGWRALKPVIEQHVAKLRDVYAALALQVRADSPATAKFQVLCIFRIAA